MTRQEMLVNKFELKPKRRPSEIESKNGNQSVSVTFFFFECTLKDTLTAINSGLVMNTLTETRILDL